MNHDKKRPRHATGVTTPSAPASREESARREEIARRAYEIYLARGGGEGRDVEDWLLAETEVLAGIANK